LEASRLLEPLGTPHLRSCASGVHIGTCTGEESVS
jgi:hypothetical protein